MYKNGVHKTNYTTGCKHDYCFALLRIITYRAYSRAVSVGDVMCKGKRKERVVCTVSKTLVSFFYGRSIFIDAATILNSVPCYWDCSSTQALSAVSLFFYLFFFSSCISCNIYELVLASHISCPFVITFIIFRILYS
jgi:hypothetical protein